MDAVQLKISALVVEYARLFPGEYESFKKGRQVRMERQRDKFGSLTTVGFLERKILEYPETLNAILNMRLTPEELQYFISREGTIWFAKEYPQFRASEKV